MPGNVVKSFGAQMSIWPHGLHIDREGNVWATDAAAKTRSRLQRRRRQGRTCGAQVQAPTDSCLMTLGEPGVAGNGRGPFPSPAGVVTRPMAMSFIATATAPTTAS